MNYRQIFFLLQTTFLPRKIQVTLIVSSSMMSVWTINYCRVTLILLMVQTTFDMAFGCVSYFYLKI